jgi:OOP family OmpA-OmpF porin
MNYSTLKKTVALSFVSLMALGMANAQTTTDTSKMASTTGPAKVFGGASQYSAFSIGVNVGVTSGQVPFFQNTTNTYVANLGYGADLRYQLSHVFSIQLEYYGGKVGGNDNNGVKDNALGVPYDGTAFSTKFNSVSLGGVFDIGSISFLHRQNGLLLYGSAGAGLDFYKPSFTNNAGNVFTYTSEVKELAAPVGVGLKFKLSDALGLNIGYTTTFVDGYNFSGFREAYPTFGHYSYTYAGLEYTFGTKSKPNIEWVNPVAMMYDELYDAALRQEVAALKGRVTNVENAVADLKKDSDGDGVSDQFDKCPNTPAGTVVDGSGCPLTIPPAVDTSLFIKKADAGSYGIGSKDQGKAAYSNIQFEFDSSVLKTSSYPALDATAADLKTTGASVELAGYASSEGTAAHNMRLSKDRANSVKTYLVNSGVAAKKLKVKAFGETHPVADNSTEAGRVLNRRVEFHKK